MTLLKHRVSHLLMATMHLTAPDDRRHKATQSKQLRNYARDPMPTLQQ